MSNTVRVRFAPSPTGYLHVGGLRTALFNYFYARSNGGKIVLRIEDTDRSRMVDDALKNLLSTFERLNIDFDEGPHIGGDFGPYVQSERLDIYNRHSEQLMSVGKAYKCFCTPERLEEVRKYLQSLGRTPMYDGRCRELSAKESSDRAENEPYVVRMKIPENTNVQFTDGVRGGISFDTSEIDDQVLLKSDGYPTYHLANVVDDHLMGITDVIRGEEWLTSTPKHILLYEYFGWEKPVFHHLPLLLNPDKSKLSKRQGDVAVEDFLDKGYLPEALINYVALLGWHPANDQEFFTVDGLISAFSMDRVSKSGAVFDLKKLRWLNKEHLKNLSYDEFIVRSKKYFPEAFDFNSELNRKITGVIRERIERFSDIPGELEHFSGKRELPKTGEEYVTITTESFGKLSKALIYEISQIADWNAESFKTVLKSAGKIAGVKGKDLFMPIRIALTGQNHGPELALIAEALGKEKFIKFIEEAANLRNKID